MKNKNVLYKIINFCIKYIGTILIIINLIIIMNFFDISFLKIENINDILSNVINFIAISTGFLMTTLSILTTANNSRIIRKLARYKKMKTISIYFAEPIIISIILVITCIIEMGLKENNLFEKINVAFIISLAIAFIIDFLKISFLCMNILQEMMEENYRDDEYKKIKANPDDAFKKNK